MTWEWQKPFHFLQKTPAPSSLCILSVLSWLNDFSLSLFISPVILPVQLHSPSSSLIKPSLSLALSFSSSSLWPLPHTITNSSTHTHISPLLPCCGKAQEAFVTQTGLIFFFDFKTAPPKRSDTHKVRFGCQLRPGLFYLLVSMLRLHSSAFYCIWFGCSKRTQRAAVMLQKCRICDTECKSNRFQVGLVGSPWQSWIWPWTNKNLCTCVFHFWFPPALNFELRTSWDWTLWKPKRKFSQRHLFVKLVFSFCILGVPGVSVEFTKKWKVQPVLEVFENTEFLFFFEQRNVRKTW